MTAPNALTAPWRRHRAIGVTVAAAAAVAGLLTDAPPAAAQATADVATAVVVSAVSLNNGGNYRIGSTSVDITVTATLKVSGKGGDTVGVQIGWSGAQAPAACVFTGSPPTTVRVSAALGPAPQLVSQVVATSTSVSECSSGTWGTGRTAVIAETVYAPSRSGRTGPVIIADTHSIRHRTNILVPYRNENDAFQVTGALDSDATPPTALQFGWVGDNGPSGCVGPRPPGTAFHGSVRLGDLAPGANYLEFGYAYLSECSTDSWFTEDRVITALVYLRHIRREIQLEVHLPQRGRISS